MKSRDLFGLGVRLLGVWLLYQGATYVAAFIDSKLFPASEKAQDSATAHLIYAMTFFILAAFFLLWTETLVNWTYAPEAAQGPDKTEGPSGSGG